MSYWQAKILGNNHPLLKYISSCNHTLTMSLWKRLVWVSYSTQYAAYLSTKLGLQGTQINSLDKSATSQVEFRPDTPRQKHENQLRRNYKNSSKDKIITLEIHDLIKQNKSSNYYYTNIHTLTCANCTPKVSFQIFDT